VGLVGEEARVLFPRKKTSITIEYGVTQHSCKRHYSIERNARNEPENPLFWRERKELEGTVDLFACLPGPRQFIRRERTLEMRDITSTFTCTIQIIIDDMTF
jgi:hypothetical protein